MKLKYRLLFPLVLLLLSFSLTLAQEPESVLESLAVAFWPDYDDPSVLVLMTGTLPADGAFPVEVTIPIPPDAEINAVASISDEGMADTAYQADEETLTFLAPVPSFRVEYYVPYTEDGDQRSFDFVWNADLDVGQFLTEIQQPANASSLTTQPAAINVITNPSDGLTYHALSSREIPAGVPFALSFRYGMDDPGLTAGGSLPTVPDASSSTASAPNSFSGIDWLLVLGGVLLLVLVAAVTWLIATRNGSSGKTRRSSKSRKPRKPAPKERSTQSKFCHNCGAQAEKEDMFCRKCGTALK